MRRLIEADRSCGDEDIMVVADDRWLGFYGVAALSGYGIVKMIKRCEDEGWMDECWMVMMMNVDVRGKRKIYIKQGKG
ncbi:hypothetical protein QVD17_16901 [Tagetes erecta]|uniref:Uncharacterized protein n=1 Tax=Tagetes erecta TaxID=13708 RepID=A0AAD8P0Z2_TARER|nr:hypothetical protein QVD17_16901 [Tagetes erecta]